MSRRRLSSVGSRLRSPLVLGVSVAALIGTPAAHAASVVPSTSTALPAAIADGGNATPPQYGATTTLAFPVSGLPSGPITDVQVKLTSTHTYVGDLDVVLVAPGGSPSRTIFSRTGAATAGAFGSGSDFLGPYTFSDGAPATPTWWSAASAGGGSVPSGSYRASEPGGPGATGANTLITPTFASATANGTWQLQIRDGSQSGTGSITAASLLVRVAGVTTVVPTIDSAGVAVNEPLPFTAAVTGGTGDATGTLGFDVYGPDNASCTGAPILSGDAPADGTSQVNAPTLVATTPGLYRVRVRYSGAPDYQPATSACNAATSSVIVSPPFVTFDTAANQTIGAGAPTTVSGRPSRGGLSSFCGAPNTPSVNGSAQHPYLAFAHTNAASTPNCVRVRITNPPACSTPDNVFVQSYASPFSASALNAHYLGDAGSSTGGSNSGYTVGAGQAFTDVAFQVSAPTCTGFTVTWQSTRPWNSSPPSVSAAPAVGASATATAGTWSGSPSFGYTWRRCADDGTACTDIPGASGTTYTPTADDLGKRLSVRVSASFVDQTSIVESAPSTPVAAAAPPATTNPTPTPAATTTPAPVSPPGPTPTPAPLSIGTVGQSSSSWKTGKLRASLGAPTKSSKAGTVFSFTIDRPATLTLTFARQTDGRKGASTCVAVTKSNAKRPRCTREQPAGSLDLVATAAGVQRVVFQGRLSATKKLAPGRYALTVTAKAGGQTATAKPVTFTVRK